jgi:hypothetical protein
MKRLIPAILLSFSLFVISPAANAQKSGASKPPQKATQSTTQGNPDAKVWANATSKTYHCPGARYYGKTKKGEYMTQKQAQEKGYRPARGNFCH